MSRFLVLGRGGLRLGRRRAAGVHASLVDPARYERQIDRLHQRHLYDGGLHQLTDGEVSLASVVMHRGHVARLLARTVERGEYRLRPATVRPIIVEGKQRTVFDYPLLDLIVHGVVAEILAEAVEPSLSASLYSYRAGLSSVDGVRAFARYLRAHRRARPDPRTRGVYVLRRDVESYTDSIPLGGGAPIWAQLDAAITALGPPLPSDADRDLISEVVRPTVLAGDAMLGDGAPLRDGAPATRVHGVATGQPISCVCFNVNLAEIDRALGAIPGAFYARYSDDLVFAHPDAGMAREVSAMLDERISALGLAFNAEKRRDQYLTGAGRASEEWPAARGTTNVAFLGMRVTMDGTVALGHRKSRRLLVEARRRAANTAAALEGAEPDIRGAAVTKTLNVLLDPAEAHLQGAAAPLLAQVVTDRRQLEQLDHQLALIVASAATGVRGPRAFRHAPYARVRAEWRLRSVRRARDRAVAPPTRRSPAPQHQSQRPPERPPQRPRP